MLNKANPNEGDKDRNEDDKKKSALQKLKNFIKANPQLLEKIVINPNFYYTEYKITTDKNQIILDLIEAQLHKRV